VRKLKTLGDLRREGELMSNCFGPKCHEGIAETMIQNICLMLSTCNFIL